MNSSFDDFYVTKNLQEFLDDELVLQQKDNNTQLQEFLISNPEIVSEMLLFLDIDDLETDHKRIIKYPFMVSEILGTLYALNQNHVQFILKLLDSKIQLPSITLGYINKILMNLLKNQPALLWDYLCLEHTNQLIQELNNYTIAELIYSLLIFQTSDNQLAFIEKRISLLEYLFNKINSDICEGISNVLIMILQQITDTLQEQKEILIKYIFNKIDILINTMNNYPQHIFNVFVALFKYEQLYKEDIIKIYQQFISIPDQLTLILQNNQQLFGIKNLAYISFYDNLINQEYILANMNLQQLVETILQLIIKYEFHNQLHKFASNIIIKLLPKIQTETVQKQIEQILLQKPPKSNRGYLMIILNKIYEINQNIQQSTIFIELNNLNNSYLLGIVPDQKPIFNLQEDLENAMDKLTI